MGGQPNHATVAAPPSPPTGRPMNAPLSPERLRFLLYAASCAAAATAMISAVTIAAIATDRMLGDATWSGTMVALSVLGTAAGSQLLGRRLERTGIRSALVTQYLLAATGAAFAAAAIPAASLTLLGSGLFLVGLGNGATQFTRYLAADAAPAHRRGRTLSWIVWMGSFGAVLGPNLLAPTGRVVQRFGLAEEAGPFLFAALVFGLVAGGYRLFLPVDDDPPGQSLQPTDGAGGSGAPIDARVATIAMVLGHVIMVWIMTMTPIELSHQGHGLGFVGVVISAHVAGMYLLAPLSGLLVDHIGSGPVMRAGAVALAFACALAALVSTASVPAVPMAAPLFLLGLGWNLGFVGGSA